MRRNADTPRRCDRDPRPESAAPTLAPSRWELNSGAARWVFGRGFAVLAVAGVTLLILVGVSAGAVVLLSVGCGVLLLVLTVAALMLYSSRVGTARACARALDSVQLHGSETVLSLGRGSGMLLLAAAQRLHSGTAIGIDQWRSGPTRLHRLRRRVAPSIADRLGVCDRIQLLEADMSVLPFPDACFDTVLAYRALHHLRPADRGQAIGEAIRVLRPGGRLAVIDTAGTWTYLTAADHAGSPDAHRSRYLPGVFPPVRLVTATARH